MSATTKNTPVRYLAVNLHSRHLDVTVAEFLAMSATGSEGTTELMSGVGAIVGCTAVALILITAYLAFRVYKQGKKTMKSKEELEAEAKKQSVKAKSDPEAKY